MRRPGADAERLRVGPLNEVETRAYIEHRLQQADWKGDPSLSEDCFSALYLHSGGLPRRINSLCSRLLLHGFLEELHTLTGRAVQKVAKDLRDENRVIAGHSDEGRPRGEAIRETNHSGVKAETLLDRALCCLTPSPNAVEPTKKGSANWWLDRANDCCPRYFAAHIVRLG
jgi:hypothetical protein